jgi:hypothetical protein
MAAILRERSRVSRITCTRATRLFLVRRGGRFGLGDLIQLAHLALGWKALHIQMVKEQLTQDKAFLPPEIPAQNGGKSHNEAQRHERSEINFPIVDPSSGPYFLCNSSPLFPSNCKRPQSPCPCKKAEDTCQRLSAVWCIVVWRTARQADILASRIVSGFPQR